MKKQLKFYTNIVFIILLTIFYTSCSSYSTKVSEDAPNGLRAEKRSCYQLDKIEYKKGEPIGIKGLYGNRGNSISCSLKSEKGYNITSILYRPPVEKNNNQYDQIIYLPKSLDYGRYLIDCKCLKNRLNRDYTNRYIYIVK